MKKLFNYQVKSPLGWYGGKTLIGDFLRSLMPWHKRYAEPFGGSGAVLFGKSPSSLDVYNDLDAGLVNFMQVVQDPIFSEELIAALYLTPNSRQEHESCKRNYPAQDRVEWARQFFVLVRQSRSGIFKGSWGYGITTRGGNFHQAIKLIRPASARLRNVRIHNLHFRELLPMYDSPDTLTYLDPPYLKSTRRSKVVYQHDAMNEADHVELLTQAKKLQGLVLISGYPSKLYNEALAGWFHVDHAMPCYSSPNKKNGPDNHKPHRLERVWLNPRAYESLRGKTTPRLGGPPKWGGGLALANPAMPTHMVGSALPFAGVLLLAQKYMPITGIIAAAADGLVIPTSRAVAPTTSRNWAA